MAEFEYKVVPAPKQGAKAKGIKGAEAQFANTLETLMNEVAADGWEYQRTDTLPCEERQGLTGRVTVFQNMLVFRRMTAAAAAEKLRAAVETAEAHRAAQPAAEPVAQIPQTPEVRAIAGPKLDKTPLRPAPQILTPDLRTDRVAAE